MVFNTPKKEQQHQKSNYNSPRCISMKHFTNVSFSLVSHFPVPYFISPTIMNRISWWIFVECMKIHMKAHTMHK